MNQLLKKTIYLVFIFQLIMPRLFSQSATIAPIELRCEYQEKPMGVDVPSPRLSWLLKSNSSKYRGLMQSAYQVMVASSPALLANNHGDIWDSGKISTDQMNQISFAGKQLTSYQSVYWKVRVWDAAGNTSEWSALAQWTMGILNHAGWQGAEWIGAPDAKEPFDPKGAPKAKTKYESILFRREIRIKPGLKRALVYMCGLAQYEMTLNGNKVGDAVLTPGWTAYDKTCIYDSYDISASLHQGANVIGLFLGNGFYNTHGERYTKVRGSYGPLQAIGLIRLEYQNGSIENIATDKKWKTSSGPIVFSSIYGGEDYDARLVQKGWDKPAFNDLAWERPETTDGPGGILKGISASAPPIRVKQVLVPIGKRQITPNVTVYDLGQNAAIMVMIKTRGSSGATVKITPSELVNENGDINDRMCNNNSYCTYTLSGKQEESYLWKFYYRGGRYLRVETKAAPDGNSLPEVANIEGYVIRADCPSVGQFACSNDLFNKVYGLIRWAQMSNMMSIMTDCPHREKLGWLEEDHLNGPALRYNFDMSGLFNKMVNDMFDAQRVNGLVPSLVPNYYNWDEGRFTTPIEWGSACIMVPWQQYEFEGDVKLLEERYDGMKRYLNYIAKRAVNNIVSFGLGDWYDNHSEGVPTLTPVGLTSTAFYYQDYHILAQIAKILRKSAEADQFNKKAAEVLNAFNNAYYNRSVNSYASGAQGSLCLPLYMGMVEKSNRQEIVQSLVNDLQAKGTTTGEISFRYLLKALADEGRSDIIYKTYNTDSQGFGLQVKLGKTSLTEAWNGGNSSQNHFMFGQINEWFYHDLAGIQSGGPGFKHIVIKPNPVGDLTWVKSSYKSIRGQIVCDWTHRDQKFSLDVVIPANTTATIYVPTINVASVQENGKPIVESSGTKFVAMELGYAVFEVGSGTYNFNSLMKP